MRKHPTMKLPKDSSNPSVNAQISAQILFDQLKAMQHVRAQETQKAENHSAQKKHAMHHLNMKNNPITHSHTTKVAAKKGNTKQNLLPSR